MEDYFATTYPIHVRRADLAKLRKSNWMTNSEFADLYIQKCNEAQVLGRSAEITDCGNCIELHRLNASNCAALEMLKVGAEVRTVPTTETMHAESMLNVIVRVPVLLDC